MSNWNNYDEMEQLHESDLYEEFMEDLKKDRSYFESWLDDMVRNGYLVHGDDGNYYREL